LLQSIADYFSPILNARLERDRQEQERREAQQRLRESEEKYRELFENAREAIVILDLDGIVTDINPFVEEYGFHKTDLIGRNHLELVVESYREKAVQDWTQLRQGIPQEGEYELLTPKGRIVVHYKDCPITREGQVIRVQSTITDVTERRRVEDALRQSEAKYHMLHDSLRDGFVSVDMEGHIIEFNKIYQEMLGYAEEELHQLTYQDLTPPEWREMEATIVNDQILARGYSDVYEKEYRRKDGIVVPIELRTVLLRDANDRPMGMWALIRDITERKQGEETLRESEARYRLLANYASDIIWTTDLNLQLTYCSPSVERILGYTLGEALSRKADEDVTPASRTLVQQTLAEEMEIERSGQGDPLRSRVIEVEEIRKDGTTLWAEIRAGFLRDANGAATGIVGVTRDISERRKLEREIVVREKYLSSFFTGATAGLALLDKDLRYVQINDTLAEMNGMPAQDHLGRTIQEVIPKLAPMVEPIFRKVFTTGEPVLNVEVTGPTVKDSSVQRHWVESFFPIVGADGTPEAVGVIVVEITERKRVEQQLLEYQDKLRELAAELTLAEERERRRIAVGVHDQIGQRLALTKLALQSLQTTTTTENNTSQVLDGICQEIDKVIEDVHSLTFELSNPILYEVGFEPAVESWLGQQIQERHGIACTFAADEPAAELDKETRVVLFDIVREILTNVVKHAQAKRVDVHIRHGDGLLQIDVRDDGIGFSPARTGASVSKSGGFGLFNIREKLEYLGGSITIDTAPAKGTSITIVVPLQHPRNSRDAKGSYENLDR
jgi:PAS domain S-box-containing protein